MLRTVNNKKVMKSKFDPLGSYTGTEFCDEYEKPVQDADNL